MSRDLIHVEIVAAVHNRRDLTLQCLASLSRLAEGISVHVIIVDDGSTDGTAKAIRDQFPAVEVISGSGELWYTEGTNVGIKRALENKPDFVLMINDDSVFDQNFLKYLVETARANPRSVVGPLLLLWDTPHKLFQTAPIWHTWGGGWRHWQQQTVWTVPSFPWRVDLIVGNCILVPSDAFAELGLMNSARYPNFGDAEFTPRLKHHGWELIVDPRARVFCQPNADNKAIRTRSLKEKFKLAFIDLHSPASLRRRLYGYLDGAPSRAAGLVAFVIFIIRALFRSSVENRDWVDRQTEPPLSVTFARARADR